MRLTTLIKVIEAGLSAVHKPSKIIAHKRKHQVGILTSGDRDFSTTVVRCMNAAGEFISPLVMFKRGRMNNCLKKRAPVGTIFGCSKKGRITSELFV